MASLLADVELQPDTAGCAACVAETLDPFSRRYRYAFTACNDCGPQRPMLGHTPCADCQREADDPGGRRFGFHGLACHACGPRPRLLRVDGRAFAVDTYSFLDDTDATTTLLGRGEVVMVKGPGSCHLACDATNGGAVQRLRTLLACARPLALLAKDPDMLHRWRVPSAEAEALAPGLGQAGLMLPATPWHHLLMRRRRAPLVLARVPADTREAALAALHGTLDWVLDHELPLPLPAPPGFDPQPWLLPAAESARVGHHHAHIAACLGEHGWPLDGGPVLGIALRAPAPGADGTLWGGEFLRVDYRQATRLGCFKPVALPADPAPWRQTWAQLMAEMGWPRFEQNFRPLDLYRFLATQPRTPLDGSVPKVGSVDGLLTAVAAAIGICREREAHPGDAALRLQALVTDEGLAEDPELDYPFATPRLDRGRGLPYIEPLAMWQALLGDLILDTPPALMAARFHRGLARAVVSLAVQLAQAHGLRTVALGGGVFQNRVLTERVMQGLRDQGLQPLLPAAVPVGDAGLPWGRALVAQARRQG